MASEKTIASLLGSTVVDKSGVEFPVEALTGPDTVIGLYFSAHWCPPCRGFTPKLAEFYNAMAATRPGALEIVFVSSDKSASEFNSYLSEMPWKALPYSDRDRKSELSAKFKVRGIPTFILLDSKGNVLTTDARTNVMEDPHGADFPWKQKTVADELADPTLKLVKSGGVDVDVATVRSAKTIGLYFSAHWCGPCRSFTPQLAAWYTKQKAAGADLEIIFVSGDRTESDFNEYLAEMPWVAIPLSNKGLAKRLNTTFEVEGIPTLVFVDGASGRLITADGRSRVMSDPDGFPWPRKPVEPLPIALGSINDTKTAVLFVDKLTDAAAVVAASEAFSGVAAEHFDADAEDPSILFALADDDDATASLRQQVGMGRDRDGPTAVSLVVFDIPGGARKFTLPASDSIPDQAAMKAFIDSVLAGTATAVSLRA